MIAFSWQIMSLWRHLWQTTPEEIFTYLSVVFFFPLRTVLFSAFYPLRTGKPPLSFISLQPVAVFPSSNSQRAVLQSLCALSLLSIGLKFIKLFTLPGLRNIQIVGIKQQPSIQVTAGNLPRYSKLFTSPFTVLQSLPVVLLLQWCLPSCPMRGWQSQFNSAPTSKEKNKASLLAGTAAKKTIAITFIPTFTITCFHGKSK